MKHDAVKVDSQDTLVAAMEDAMARAASVFSSGSKTLVDTITQDKWDNWDESGEAPNVSDSAQLSSEDEFDDCELTAA